MSRDVNPRETARFSTRTNFVLVRLVAIEIVVRREVESSRDEVGARTESEARFVTLSFTLAGVTHASPSKPVPGCPLLCSLYDVAAKNHVEQLRFSRNHYLSSFVTSS